MPIEKRWVVKPQGDSEAVAKLAAVLRISPVLANLLVQRGIDTVEKADKFFKPSLADLHDPFLMKDMDKAVERVEQAVRRLNRGFSYASVIQQPSSSEECLFCQLRRLAMVHTL